MAVLSESELFEECNASSESVVSICIFVMIVEYFQMVFWETNK